MNMPGMENITKLEKILMEMVSRRFERESVLPTLTPIEMKAAEILTEIFRLKADMRMNWLQEESWKTSEQIHEAEDPDEKMENKHYIVKALEDVLKMTRAGENIEGLIYESEYETVHIRFRNGYTKMVSVDCDSGIATTRDVVNAL